MLADDFFEIAFHRVETRRSGDAIALWYRVNGRVSIHVVDGGYQSTGTALHSMIRESFGNPRYIDNVIATHNDGDHAKGLLEILESFEVGALWMLRPWLYADELIHRFATYTSVDRLRSELRSNYPNLAALEEVALRRGIPIRDAFQGTQIGAFVVMAPTRARYLELIVTSTKTPLAARADNPSGGIFSAILDKARAAVSYVRAGWGVEYFPPEDTSNENEMSIVQFAHLSGQRILLTADTGRDGLREVVEFAPYIGLNLPGIDHFQVPHHGGRRNVSSELLDAIVGPRVPTPFAHGIFTAIVSSAKEDPDHPRNVVKRALIHRGAAFYETEGTTIWTRGGAVPHRALGLAAPAAYPETLEE